MFKKLFKHIAVIENHMDISIAVFRKDTGDIIVYGYE